MMRFAAAACVLLVGGGSSAAAFGPGHAGSPAQAGVVMGLQVAQIIVRERIIIRTPNGDRPIVQAGNTLFQWRESNGPRCVEAGDVIGATLSQSSVDLIMRDASRMRARLAESCLNPGYLRGFYVNATTDGRICASRDAIRSRMGSACGITAFRQLQPVRR